MTQSIEQRTTEIRGNTHTLHFLLCLPQPVEKVWTAVATPEGLRGWLAPADVFEPRLGGAVALRLDDGTAGTTPAAAAEGRITAWDVERVAEYTVEDRGRVRFHLEPTPPDGTTLRFTHELQGGREPDWRARFQRLLAFLQD